MNQKKYYFSQLSKDFFNVLLLTLESILFVLTYLSTKEDSNFAYMLMIAVIGSVFLHFLIYNGFSILTLVITCLNALLLPIIVQYYSGTSYGLLELNLVQIHFRDILFSIYIYDSIFLLLSIILKFKEKELTVINRHEIVSNTKFSIFVTNMIALIFSFVAFPRGFTMSVDGAERFDMLLPGHAWNQLVIVALVFNLKYLKNNRSVQLTYLFCVMWFLLHGERADIAGLFLGIFFYWMIQQKKIFTMKNIFLLFSATLSIGLLNLVGYIRINGKIPNVMTVFSSIATTATLSDVGYLLNTAIDYSLNTTLTHGKVLLSNIMSAIPFHNQVFGFSNIIDTRYINPGGEPLIGQPLIDFGIVGIPFSAMIDFILFYFILLFKSKLARYEYLLLLFAVPRIVWYGRSYVFTSLIFFVPFMYFLINWCNSISKDT